MSQQQGQSKNPDQTHGQVDQPVRPDKSKDILEDQVTQKVSELIESGITGESEQEMRLSESDIAAKAVEHSKMPDEKLVELANEADDMAFACLYERYRNWVWSILVRLSHDDDVLEMLQETFLQFLRQFPGLSSKYHVKANLYVLTLRVLKEQEKKRLRKDGDKLQEALGDRARVAQSPNLPDQLSHLPLAQREALILHFNDGLTFEDIAYATDVPAGTVKSRIYLAIRALNKDSK